MEFKSFWEIAYTNHDDNGVNDNRHHFYCYTVEPLWKGQESLTKVAKFGPFLCTILYKSCLFYPSWQATSFERPPSWVTFIEGFHCIYMFVYNYIVDSIVFGRRLYSCSTDKTLAVWDMGVGERIKRLKGHTTFVNSLDVARRGPQIICSGSDDGTIKVNRRGVMMAWG